MQLECLGGWELNDPFPLLPVATVLSLPSSCAVPSTRIPSSISASRLPSGRSWMGCEGA